MPLKARAGCGRSILRVRTGEVDAPLLESVCVERLARELHLFFGFWEPQV